MPDVPRRTWIKWNENPKAGRFIKWQEQVSGFIVEGTWCGQLAGDYGPLGLVEEPDKGTVKFPLPTSLYERLATMPKGVVLRIEYLGKQVGKKSGKEYHDFDVLVDPSTLPELAALPPDPEVPF